jgi:hypothetical protein
LPKSERYGNIEQRVLAIGFAAVAQPRLLANILRDAAQLGRQEGFASIRWLAPVQDEVQVALQDAGYVTDWEHTGYLYAKPHPGA